jgi:hypothetical protein
MKKLTAKQRQRILGSIAAIPDDEIDTSDIPELTKQQMKLGVRGQMYRGDVKLSKEKRVKAPSPRR